MAIVWFLLWVVFAFGVLGFLGWSVNTLIAQKKAWSEFAAKYKLDVAAGVKLMDPVTITGRLNGRRLDIYSRTEQNESERTQRIYSHVEVHLNVAPPFAFILSRKALPEMFADITLPEHPAMPGAGWPTMAVAMTDDAYGLANWLSSTRLRALKTFMDSAAGRMHEALLIGDGAGAAILLWRTQDPLKDPRDLNALVQRLYGYARELDLDNGSSAKPKGPSESTPPSSTA